MLASHADFFSTISLSFYLIAYLFGSINAAIIISKIMKLPPPSTIGSGNPGATNMLRSGGKKAGALTLLLDLLKGLIIVLIARFAFHLITPVLSLIGLFAIIGHIFPLFFKFKGGKGVATLIGALLGATPLIGFCFIWVWLVMLALFRISSLSALIACVASPVIAYFTEPKISAWVILISVLLVIIRHRENIKRLCLKQEKKVGQKQGSTK